MTAPNDFELLELATPYALHAVTDSERADIDRQLAAAPVPVAAAFGDEVRAVRETMAVVSAATATEPPSCSERLVKAAAFGPSRGVVAPRIATVSGIQSSAEPTPVSPSGTAKSQNETVGDVMRACR